MRRLGMLFCLLAACSTGARTPAPASPTRDPAADAAAPPAAPARPVAEEDVTRYDRPGICEPVRGTVVADFPDGYSLIELVTWYMDVTCGAVLIPRVVLERRTARAISERVDAAQAAELFHTLLGHLRLSNIGTDELIVIAALDRDLDQGSPLGIIPGNAPERESERAPEPPSEPERAAEQPREDSPDPVSTRELDAGIQKIDETHYVIRRDLFERFLANPMQYSRMRIVPAVEDGNINGFKLYAIRPDSIAARLGLRNGDSVHAVNGMSIATPDMALEVYTKLREAKRIELDITRRGKSLVLVIDIEPTP